MDTKPTHLLLAAVAAWARSMKPHTYPWFLGFSGIPLCEYYLHTGDQAVLPTIQKAVDNAVATQYNDAWAGRGNPPAFHQKLRSRT